MWAPGGPPGPAGWDRRRVGARLRAALAGLHELQGLRATQQARVRGALAMQPPPGPAEPRGPRGHELRLEATLAALQEQLSRLRRQDAGLKTHLDQLDQQISELQLDVCRSSSEAPDSDSRPSSGFYELSDMGSCSLSTSCASVCSDRLSPSLGSWLPAFQPSKARPGMGDWRPRSADETTVPTWRPQPNEQHTRPLDGAEDVGQPWDMFQPRPVSTGDLEKVLPADLGLQTASTDTVSSSLLCQGLHIPHHSLDPKYQRDLVARGGQEVYLYPSPLHAVALQSPLFAVTKETPQLSSHSPPRTPPLGSRDLNRTQAGPVRELGPAGAYIDRLLHLRGQRPPQRGIIGEQGPPRYSSSSSPQKLGSQRSGGGNQPDKLVCAPGIAGGGSAQSRVASGDSFQQQGPVPLDTQTPSINPEEGPKPWNHYIHGDITVGLSPCPQTQQPHSDHGQDQLLSPSRTVDSESASLAPGLFAHPPCTTGEVSPVRLKIGSPQSKAVKIRRRASDKVLRFGKQPAPLPDRYQGTYAAPQLPLEWDLSYRPQGGGLGRRPTLARDASGRSCSESTLYPVPFFVPVVVSPGESYQASSQALFPVEAAPFSAGTRRKQRKWQSTVEISARALAASYPEPHLGPPRRTARKESGPQARGRPLLARQDACAKSESDPSEHSAECASLFHSTIAETSEEEASDHTANRFGDQESSPSDSEGYIQSSGGSLATDGAEAGPGKLNKPRVAPHKAPGGTRPPLPPMPKLCRIKASKALKRKIRRFQPTALKVMTMV